MMMYDIEVMIEEVVGLKCLFTSICNSPICGHATLLKPKRRKTPLFENHNLGRGREVLGTSQLVVAFTNTRQNKDEKGGINDEKNMIERIGKGKGVGYCVDKKEKSEFA